MREKFFKLFIRYHANKKYTLAYMCTPVDGEIIRECNSTATNFIEENNTTATGNVF